MDGMMCAIAWATENPVVSVTPSARDLSAQLAEIARNDVPRPGDARRTCTALYVFWTGWPEQRALDVVDEINASWGAVEDERRDAVIRCLDELIRAGLELREGCYLLPPAIVKADMRLAFDVWVMLRFLRMRALGVDTLDEESADRIEGAAAVCPSCHAVFRPRRSDQRFCGAQCSRDQLPPPLGSVAPQAGQRFRVPVTFGHAVTGWHTGRLVDPGDGELLPTRRATRRHATPAARQAAYRARRLTG